MVSLSRLCRHLATPPRRLRAAFPPPVLSAIEAAIRAGETRHLGEIRFVVEGALSLGALWRGQTARERALEIFSLLRVWDTEHNNGVLVYLLLADRDVEIVADRGINLRVGEAEWERLCRVMETHFRAGEFERGVLEAVAGIAAHCERHYPFQGENPNELPDRPALL